jgi:CCR4-NOT transcription complex subunit 1
MGIMSVLAEMHGTPDFKLNLKFEIEVLCKQLEIQLNVSNESRIRIKDSRVRICSDSTNMQIGTPQHFPPCLLLNRRTVTAAEIFAVGSGGRMNKTLSCNDSIFALPK